MIIIFVQDTTVSVALLQMCCCIIQTVIKTMWYSLYGE
jgi:hypothetical protein